ncbi:hypothetical protein INR49_028571, partial [Caranx melampygus]
MMGLYYPAMLPRGKQERRGKGEKEEGGGMNGEHTYFSDHRQKEKRRIAEGGLSGFDRGQEGLVPHPSAFPPSTPPQNGLPGTEFGPGPCLALGAKEPQRERQMRHPRVRRVYSVVQEEQEQEALQETPQRPKGPPNASTFQHPLPLPGPDLRQMFGQFGKILDVEIIFNERGSK